MREESFEMPDIKHDVAAGARNDDDDVIVALRFLNAVAIADGGANPILDIDGWRRATTIRFLS
jgi:hypothetical protein